MFILQHKNLPMFEESLALPLSLSLPSKGCHVNPPFMSNSLFAVTKANIKPALCNWHFVTNFVSTKQQTQHYEMCAETVRMSGHQNDIDTFTF